MRKKVKNGIVLAFKVLVSAGILYILVFRKVLPKEEEIDLIRQTLAGLDWTAVALWIAGAFAVKATGMLFTVVRWRCLLRGQGLDLGFWHATGSFLIGRFIGSVSPGTSGLDGWRFYDVGRHARNYVSSGAVIVVEKIIGFFVLSLLLVATLPLSVEFFARNPEITRDTTRYVKLFLLAAGVPLTLCVAVLLRPGWIGTLAGRVVGRGSRIGRVVFRVVDSVTAYEAHRPDLLKAVVSGVPIHVATCGMYYFTAHAIGVPVTLVDVMFVAPLMIAATVVPVSIAGIGVREMTFVAFLGPVYGSGLVALFAFLGYLVGQAISLLGGPVWFARRADYRMFRQAREASSRGPGSGSGDEDPESGKENEPRRAA
jgi:uncharacterized membrane protein YbhN (UPF0104 family)